MTKVVLASANAGKVAELAKLLEPYSIQVACLADYPQIGSIDETGKTFAENALIKAKAIATATGQIAIGDDSGLIVDALAGQPGIFSARYADNWPALPGESRDERNIRKLLHHLTGVAAAKRTARFVAAIAAASPNGAETVCSGSWEGIILARRLGVNGFGYDSVFFDPKLGKSAAQLSQTEKNAISHRGKALKSLLDHWAAFMRRAEES